MQYRILLLLLCFAMPVLAQDTTTYLEQQDIPYRSGEQTDYMKTRCRLDIYYPARHANVPVIVWFHGGGLTGGSKEIPAALKKQHMIIIAVNYRLSPKVTCPAYIEDAAAAVAWAFNHAKEYGGNPSKIIVSGHSAGAYLTEMVGLDKQWLAKYNIDANRIAALFPFSGQAITHFTVRKERGLGDTQVIIDTYAPLYHVRADAPPMYLYTGDREQEMLGRYEENAYLARMMKLAGHKRTYLYEFDGFAHGDMPGPGFLLMLKQLKTLW
ncbi:MAG TPA: alpha/beta hydrolase [Chitinophaga sp.]|uniref:alpha/beta hydrolase n=1 Tax=Chitinophaga sp. TaxID=1869181 RepID=UPI002DC05646|nr:alpha/beta hydrolase [Chitinophaga sp.]HEU4551928.1 alpha/beta hydrolase [Chitinophaga sp.]